MRTQFFQEKLHYQSKDPKLRMPNYTEITLFIADVSGYIYLNPELLFTGSPTHVPWVLPPPPEPSKAIDMFTCLVLSSFSPMILAVISSPTYTLRGGNCLIDRDRMFQVCF